MTNAQNDARYLAVGRMIYPKKNPDHDDELKRANKKKNGHPYRYAESTILALATMRAFCGLSYRILGTCSRGVYNFTICSNFDHHQI